MSLDTVLGIAGLLVGLYIFMTRFDPMRIGDYAFSYVLHWGSMGCGCMVGGLYATETGVTFSYATLLLATVSYLMYQRRAGVPWTPPEHAKIEKHLP